MDVFFYLFVGSLVVKQRKVLEIDSSLMHDIFKFLSIGEFHIATWYLFSKLYGVFFYTLSDLLKYLKILSRSLITQSTMHELIYIVQ